MKLLNYLSQTSKHDRFNDLFEKLDLLVDTYDITEVNSFKDFIVRTPTIRDAKYLLIDLTDTNEQFTCENILQGVDRLISFTQARPIFLLTRNDDTVLMAASLTDKGVRNIIFVDEKSEEQLKDELTECFSQNGKSFIENAAAVYENSLQQMAINNTQVKFELPKGKTLQITVCGAKGGVGATTQCLQISDYLFKTGLKPIVVTFDTRFYDKLKCAYDLKENLVNALEVNNTHIAQRCPISANYNVIIYDFGKLKQEESEFFIKADISIVISTSRAWDIGDIARTENMLCGKKHLLWFNFCNNEEFSTLDNWDKLAETKKACIPYQTNPFVAEDFAFYHSNLLVEIKKVCGYD